MKERQTDEARTTMAHRPWCAFRSTRAIGADPLLPRLRSLRLLFFVAVIAASTLSACGRSEKDRAKKETVTEEAAPSANVEPAPLPSYDLPRDLEAQQPEVVAFLKQFLETCYARDYASYRLMVVREEDPESRERFEAIVRAVNDIRVESIREIELPDRPPPTYLVVTQVEFKADSRVALRRANRKLAILVLKENGEWRMAPAPAHLQPKSPGADEPPPESQPVEVTYFPWDSGG